MLDKPVENVRKMLKLNERVSSIDSPIGSESDRSLVDTIADEQVLDPSDLLQDANMKENIISWIQSLNEKQAEVISRRFGLMGYDPSTLEEVGKAIGLTRERVRQIQVDALRRLRRTIETEGLSSESIFDDY